MNQLELEEKTINFSKEVVSFCVKNKNNYPIKPLLDQLIRSATSVGANYREANAACSLKDFKNKIYICKKEARETSYWLELLLGNASDDDLLITLKDECNELEKIFGKITVTLLKKEKNQNLLNEQSKM